MLTSLVTRLVGNRNERILKKYAPFLAQIKALAPECQTLKDEQLAVRYQELKARHAQGETLDALLPPCFALVQEAGARALGMRHFDVQLLGGMAMHSGRIAEMSTGEGKTLAATLPAALNALTGRGVHLVTVNDYLVKRDAQWMKPLYNLLGLRVGVVCSEQSREEKKEAYQADVIYATNNELGFDYLREQMVYRVEDRVRQDLFFAIVDEVDSIFIDEARTPLIISGAAEDSSALYQAMNAIPLLLTGEGDTPEYTIDHQSKSVSLTEAGHERVEGLLQEKGLLPPEGNLYDPAYGHLIHHLMASMRAHVLFKRDVDYLVANQQVMIVDEHTGRTMPGRRWSEGLHQALEAKEGMPIQQENQTLASITYQNFFLLYDKLAGMTGTADTEAFEFQEIYNLEVVVIPPNRLCQRIDLGDVIYLTQNEKNDALVADLKARHHKGQPVLMGTTSIEQSELLSKRLKKEKIPHQILNAKYHEREAHIIAEAGRPGAVTIATNMAGRGTDIVLGGCLATEEAQVPEGDEKALKAVQAAWAQRHAQVVAAGGLHVLGSERHPSRRIDNQLRGRSGRQGDPGSSQFFLSLDDPLMRSVINEKMTHMMRRLGVQPGESITHPWITNAVESAQKKIEGYHFDQRKQVLQFDNVINDQRRVMYALREHWLTEEDVTGLLEDMLEAAIQSLSDQALPTDSMPELWDIPGYTQKIEQSFGVFLPLAAWLKEEPHMEEEVLKKRLQDQLKNAYHLKVNAWSETVRNSVQRSLALHYLDVRWREHLSTMEHLRQAMFLRGYAQKDPKQEYKREAFVLFTHLMEAIKLEIISALMYVQVDETGGLPDNPTDKRRLAHLDHEHQAANMMGHQEEKLPRKTPGRNEPCPCGSEKKYKHCHGRLG